MAFISRGSVMTYTGVASPPAAMVVAHLPEEIRPTYDYILSIPPLGISDTLSKIAFLGPIHKVMTISDAVPAYCIDKIGSHMYKSLKVTTKGYSNFSAGHRVCHPK